MAATPYTRSASNMLYHQQSSCADQSCQSPPFFQQNNDIFCDAMNNRQIRTPLSNATSSSTLVNNKHENGTKGNFLPTPGNTPKTERKGKRISNIFVPFFIIKDFFFKIYPCITLIQRKEHIATPDERIAKSLADVNMGVGRAIPLKQGQLYKRSKKGLNKEWKKKFVCLYSGGRICYHQNLKVCSIFIKSVYYNKLQDYMDKDSHGKEIFLGLATGSFTVFF